MIHTLRSHKPIMVVILLLIGIIFSITASAGPPPSMDPTDTKMMNSTLADIKIEAQLAMRTENAPDMAQMLNDDGISSHTAANGNDGLTPRKIAQIGDIQRQIVAGGVLDFALIEPIMSTETLLTAAADNGGAAPQKMPSKIGGVAALAVIKPIGVGVVLAV